MNETQYEIVNTLHLIESQFKDLHQDLNLIIDALREIRDVMIQSHNIMTDCKNRDLDNTLIQLEKSTELIKESKRKFEENRIL